MGTEKKRGKKDVGKTLSRREKGRQKNVQVVGRRGQNLTRGSDLATRTEPSYLRSAQNLTVPAAQTLQPKPHKPASLHFFLHPRTACHPRTAHHLRTARHLHRAETRERSENPRLDPTLLHTRRSLIDSAAQSTRRRFLGSGGLFSSENLFPARLSPFRPSRT